MDPVPKKKKKTVTFAGFPEYNFSSEDECENAAAATGHRSSPPHRAHDDDDYDDYREDHDDDDQEGFLQSNSQDSLHKGSGRRSGGRRGKVKGRVLSSIQSAKRSLGMIGGPAKRQEKGKEMKEEEEEKQQQQQQQRDEEEADGGGSGAKEKQKAEAGRSKAAKGPKEAAVPLRTFASLHVDVDESLLRLDDDGEDGEEGLDDAEDLDVEIETFRRETDLENGDSANGSGSGSSNGRAFPKSSRRLVLFQGGGEQRKQRATVLSSVANLANTIAGAGTLALPFAVRNSGLVLGLLSLVFVYFVANFSLRLLLLCTTYIRLSTELTYKELAKTAHGWTGVALVCFGIIFGCFGTMCSYLIILTDATIPFLALAFSVDVSVIVEQYRLLVLTVILLAVLPLASLSKLDSLRFTSALALFSIFYIVFLVIIRGVEALIGGALQACLEVEGCFSLWDMSLETTATIPIITLAYSCQMNFFTIVNELKAPTFRKVTRVSVGATTICLVAYLFVALFGYLTFYHETKGNILLNFPVNDLLANIGRVAVIVIIVASYPMMSHPAVKTFDELCFKKWVPSRKRWVIEAVAFSVAAWGVAAVVQDISLVLSFVGATAASTITFILPATCYIALCPDKRRFTPVKIAAGGMFLVGVGFMIMRTYILFAVDLFGK